MHVSLELSKELFGSLTFMAYSFSSQCKICVGQQIWHHEKQHPVPSPHLILAYIHHQLMKLHGLWVGWSFHHTDQNGIPKLVPSVLMLIKWEPWSPGLAGFRILTKRYSLSKSVQKLKHWPFSWTLPFFIHIAQQGISQQITISLVNRKQNLPF